MSNNANNSKRKTILPLHIDTASFTGGGVQSQNNLYAIWRRLNKRQLPLFVLLTILFISLFLNLVQHNKHSSASRIELFKSQEPLPPVPFTESHRHAIIVAGHAIYTGSSDLEDVNIDANWILESYQQGGQVNTFLRHIRQGVDILRHDAKSVLIFSG
jgi:hypothetical protein